MKPEETFDFHIRWAWARISRLYNAEASNYGGTMSIGYVLLNIDKEGTPSTKLGPKMGMESRSLTRSLKSMEDMGLIERRSDPKDRRMVRVFLTKEGERIREVSKESVLRFNRFFEERWGKDKSDEFLSMLTEFNELLEDDSILSNHKVN